MLIGEAVGLAADEQVGAELELVDGFAPEVGLGVAQAAAHQVHGPFLRELAELLADLVAGEPEELGRGIRPGPFRDEEVVGLAGGEPADAHAELVSGHLQGRGVATAKALEHGVVHRAEDVDLEGPIECGVCLERY